MRGRLVSLLLSGPLLLSLAALIANDLFLKYSFPGLLTGKLSDFAGIFLVSYLAFGLFPHRRLVAAVTIAGLFAWWKSPLSTLFIESINAIAPVRFVRVVDYWDLLAFLIMPLALLLARDMPLHPQKTRKRTALSVPVAVVALFAMTATSIYMPTRAFRIQNADADYVMDESQAAAVVERVANNYGSECYREDPDVPGLACQGPDVWIFYLFDETTNTAQLLVQNLRQNGFFLTEADPHLLSDVLSDLKSGFAGIAPNMEYVEALEEDSHQQFAEFYERICGEDSQCDEE